MSGASFRRDDRAAIARELQTFIVRNPEVFGGADIYNLDFGTPVARAGMLAAVLTGLVDGDRRPAVRRFVIVVAPGREAANAFEDAWTQLVATFMLLAQREMDPREREWIKNRIEIVVTTDRRFSSVLDVIAAQSERSVVIVTEAASFRDDDVEAYIATGATTPLRSEDVWAPQLHALASAAVALARERALYVALDANELSPGREALASLLLSIDGCGVMGSSSDDDPETILSVQVDQWDAWVREGRLGQALNAVDALPEQFDDHKPFLRIQLLHRAGHLQHALQAIREEIALGRALDGCSRVKLARIAEDADASALASQILGPAIDALDNREDLESALVTARNIGSDLLEEQVAARLNSLFPGSASLRQRRRRLAASSRDYKGAAAIAAEAPGDEASVKFYETLSRFLSVEQVPDYHALLSEAGRDQAMTDAYRMASVSDALSRKLVVHAFDLATPLPSTQAQQERGERLLLRTLEQLLLAIGSTGALPVASGDFQAAFVTLIERLAAEPSNQALRIGLVRLVQPAVAGTTGLALLAAVVLQLASRPIQLRKGGAPGKAGMAWLMERKAFLNAGFEWLKAEEPVVIGRLSLPDALMTEPPDEVVSAVADYLTFAPIDTAEDTGALLLWLAFGTSVVPHTSDPSYDLRLIRLVAGKLASAGEVQQARDLAEQAILNSASNEHRRRLGWFAMADVYNRCGIQLEALLAIACTLAASDTGDEEEVYQEITGVARVLRDCGLHDHARMAIGKARDLLNRMGLSETYAHQLDTVELQIRQMGLGMAGAPDAEIKMLLTDVIENARAVIEHRGLTAPAGVMLGQLLRLARERGVAIPDGADELFGELRKHAKGNLAKLMETMTTATPSADDLLAVARAGGSARYSDDVGFDMRNGAIVAGRALASSDFISDPERTSFALEMLTDRGVAVPGWDEAAVPAAAPGAIGEPAEIARAISRGSISVVQAGFDEFGSLVRVSTIDGNVEAPVRESGDVIAEERLKRWAVDFPYAYGIDESTANLFYTSTADLRLSELPKGPVVFVANASLQSFPPNLLYVDEEFAGRTRPMAAAPSLAWLGEARTKGMIGDGRLCAWISTAIAGESQTLSMIAQRLEPTLNAHGFIVDNGPTLPKAFAGARMAVITAHGGVHPEGKYFQVVSDEGILRVTAGDLANALRNVSVVILFVCSGGRADKHPAANTTLGLAKQILDRGCAAVIASPWPLDARVPSHWLPAFLDHWKQGRTLIDANFEANRVVDRTFAQDPARGLAMTVFGNPELNDG